MNVFQAVKEAVSTRTAAENYGIDVRRNGMALCPFHDDHEPSLKVDNRYHCFGCNADGDVIDFVGRLFDLSPKQSAEKLAHDFGISLTGLESWKPEYRPSVIAKLTAAQEYRRKEDRCYHVLCDYFRLLQDWRERYVPQPTDEDWHPRFCEALGRSDYIEYLLDELINGTYDERSAVVKGTAQMVDSLEKRIAMYREMGKTEGGLLLPKSASATEPPHHICRQADMGI